MIKIGVIFGGKSSEHEVSLLSATSVIKAIDRSKYEVHMIGITREGVWMSFPGPVEMIADGSWEKHAMKISMCDIKDFIDFALPIMHGAYGEDGTIQGVFEMLDIPYAGCGVLASSLCMDKVSAKQVFDSNGIPTNKYMLVFAEEIRDSIEDVIKKIEDRIPYTLYVKPANMGSSVGISKVKSRKELGAALLLAIKYDRRIIVEEGINCREIETGVIGNSRPKVAAVGEILAKKDFYDYSAKYSDDSGTELSIPADIPADTYKEIRRLALKAYKALDCAGFARVDFFVDRDNGNIYINEINTIPGFTKYSMFPSLWKEAGLSFGELIERIVEFGYERYNTKDRW